MKIKITDKLGKIPKRIYNNERKVHEYFDYDYKIVKIFSSKDSGWESLVIDSKNKKYLYIGYELHSIGGGVGLRGGIDCELLPIDMTTKEDMVKFMSKKDKDNSDYLNHHFVYYYSDNGNNELYILNGKQSKVFGFKL